MYSNARKLAAACFIFVVLNILALLMVVLLLLGLSLEFYVFFTILLYVLTITSGILVLTIGLRSSLEDAEVEAQNTSLQIKKLSDRIKELEKMMK